MNRQMPGIHIETRTTCPAIAGNMIIIETKLKHYHYICT